MCNPALIGAGLAVGGMVANRYGDADRENKSIDASNKSARDELARQQQSQADARANLNRTLGQVSNSDGRMDQLASQREQTLGDLVSTATPSNAGVRADAPGIVQEGFDKARADAETHTTMRNAGIAKVGALGDLIGQNNGSAADTRVLNGQIGDTAGRSFAINNLERRSAALNAGRRPTMTLGDVLQLASLATSFGTSGLFTGAGAAAGATTVGGAGARFAAGAL